MIPEASNSQSLDDLLRRLNSKLDSWQVRALFLGAQASAKVPGFPQHLLHDLFDADFVLDDGIHDANFNVIVDTWNQLVDERRVGAVRLSDLRVGDPPTASDLAAVAERRAGEISWFLRGVDAGGKQSTELGPEGREYLRRLTHAAGFCEVYKLVLDNKQDLKQHEVSESVVVLARLTIAVITLIEGLLIQAEAKWELG